MNPSSPLRWFLRPFGFVWFLLRFLKELIVANVDLARAVVFQPVADMHPGFLTYDTSGLSALEVLVLSHCITLTPGTTTVEVAEDRSHLVLHAFDARNPEGVRESIRRGLEAPMKAWTR